MGSLVTDFRRVFVFASASRLFGPDKLESKIKKGGCFPRTPENLLCLLTISHETGIAQALQLGDAYGVDVSFNTMTRLSREPGGQVPQTLCGSFIPLGSANERMVQLDLGGSSNPRRGNLRYRLESSRQASFTSTHSWRGEG